MGDKSSPRLEVKTVFSKAAEASVAIREVGRKLEQTDPKLVALFVSPSYDLRDVAREIKATFGAPVIGCTTSGEITPEHLPPPLPASFRC